MPKNIYNFNKKGFLIGFRRSLKRIITRATKARGIENRPSRLGKEHQNHYILKIAHRDYPRLK
jgi:hypothetical protein